MSHDATLTPAVEPKRTKPTYVGAPAIFLLELACRDLNIAFGDHGCYLVGSALERPDWRDIDVRFIMVDDAWDVLFPDANLNGAWEFDPRWLWMCTSISERLSRITGLPVDFQFQRMSDANERHKKRRQPLGLHYVPRGQGQARDAE